MKLRPALMIIAAHLSFGIGLPAWSQTTIPDSWENLYHVTHGRAYIFADRDGNCTDGRIKSVNEQSVEVRIWIPGPKDKGKTETVTLSRNALVRVNDGPKLIDVIYTAKSSWSDIRALRKMFPDERVLVITKDGRQQKGKSPEATDTSLRLIIGNNDAEFAKGVIAKLYYVRVAPVSAGAQYSDQEGMAIFDPRMWAYLLHIAPKIKVLIYDASMPEDDSGFHCADNPHIGSY